MRILVTGHLGYIGCVLTRMLLDRDHEVVGLDTDLYRRCTYGAADGVPRVPTIARDVRDVEPGDVRGADAVLHLAGLSNDPLGDLDADLTMDVNHRASVRLAEIARDAGVPRFVFSSSCSNYGAGADALLDEDAPFNPVTPYGRSKVAVERDVAPMASDRFSPVFLRSATAYGLSPRIRFDLVVNNLAAWAFTTGDVLLKSDGTPWRPVVHVQDIARAFVAAVEAPREAVHGRAFNVADTRENYRVAELARIVGEEVPGSRVRLGDDASPDVRTYRVRGDRLAATLPAATPRWTARQGVRELLDAYRTHGLELEDFEGPRFRRVDHVRMLVERGLLDATLRPTAATHAAGPPAAPPGPGPGPAAPAAPAGKAVSS